MGIIYRARHHAGGHLVALKTLRAVDAALLHSMRREVHVLAGLHHPGIVRIADEGVHDGLPWYAMELLEGTPLSRLRTAPSGAGSPAGSPGPPAADDSTVVLPHAWSPAVPSTPPVPETATGPPPATRAHLDALTVVRRLCEPLAFLHGEGLVHRDLKPANVIVRPDGQPVLVDFGLATRSHRELGREDVDDLDALNAGTAAYMAPEHLRGELLDARADLYALGCILFELVAGRRPFTGALDAIVDGHLHVPAPRLRDVVRTSADDVPLPDGLEELVGSLLAKDRRDRLGYADDVGRALAALGAADGGGAGPAARTYLYRPGLAGRGPAWRALDAALAPVRAGRGAVALVGGESGVGKTRLVVEVVRRLEAGGVEAVGGRCLPRRSGEGGGATAPLHAFASLLQLLGDRCRAGGPAVTDRLLGLRGPLLAAYEPELAELPGQAAHPEPAELPADAARLRLFRALAETLAAASSPDDGWPPLVVVLDDLHWADELTLGAVTYLARSGALADVPVAIVSTYRTEEAGAGIEELADAPGVARVALDRLDADAVSTMVGEMLALRTTPRRLAPFLASVSEGNPLFVGEYLRAAVEERVLWRDPRGTWQVEGSLDAADAAATDGSGASPGLPRTLHALLARRLDDLPAAARDVLDATAVVGRRVDVDLLSSVTGRPLELVWEGTHELLRRQVIEAAGADEHQFAHDKLREAAYARLGVEQRRALHAAVATSLERRATVPEDLPFEELGGHWHEAGDGGRARACFVAAARRDREVYALDAAAALYRRALALLDRPTLERVGLRHELATDVLEVAGRVADAIAEHRLELEDSRALHDRGAELRALRGLGTTLISAGHADEARAVLTDALALARRLGERAEEGHVLAALSDVEALGDPERGIALIEAAVAVHREVGNRRAEAIGLANLGGLELQEGRNRQATELLEQALGLQVELGDRAAEGATRGTLGVALRLRGALAEARAQLEQALELFREVGDRRREAQRTATLADVLGEQGRYEEAAARYEQALPILRELGDVSNEAYAMSNYAETRRDQGRIEEAHALYDRALELARATSDVRLESYVLGALAEVHAALGDLEVAHVIAERALELVRPLRSDMFEAIALRQLAAVERRSGRWDVARGLLQRAEPALVEADDAVGLTFLGCERGHVELAGGRSAAATLEAVRAHCAARDLGPESRVGPAVAHLSAAEEAWAAGRPDLLWQGELVAALPEGLRRRVEATAPAAP